MISLVHYIFDHEMHETFCHKFLTIMNNTNMNFTTKLEDVNCDECYDEMKKALNTWRLLKYE